jgi:dTDP-L-rhamnose 4-epimerase
MSETVLVTGGAGFIGSFLVDELVRLGHHVINYDNIERQVHRNGPSSAHLNPHAEFIAGDIRDRESLEKVVARADVVSHQAALVGVGQSMYQIERYVDINIRGTSILLDILVNSSHHVRKVMVAASMSAYGEGQYECRQHGSLAPQLRSEDQMRSGLWELKCPTCHSLLMPQGTSEDKPLSATSVYAITKQTQEQLVLNVCEAFRIPAVALRYFNAYGPRQSLDNPYTGVAAIFMSRLKNDRPPLVFEDGEQTRDFVSVHDIVAANIAAMFDSRADNQVFNVGTGRRVSILELSRVLAKLLGKDVEPQVVGKYRKGDIRHCFANIDRIQGILDWAPQVQLEDGLLELVTWSESVGATDLVDSATEELRARGLLVD